MNIRFGVIALMAMALVYFAFVVPRIEGAGTVVPRASSY